MFHNGFCSDLVLVFGGRRFNVHRAILAARSPKFQKMIGAGNSEIQFPNVSNGSAAIDGGALFGESLLIVPRVGLFR